jgi:hypothetical protein
MKTLKPYFVILFLGNIPVSFKHENAQRIPKIGKTEVMNLYSLCGTQLKTYRLQKIKTKKDGNFSISFECNFPSI